MDQNQRFDDRTFIYSLQLISDQFSSQGMQQQQQQQLLTCWPVEMLKVSVSGDSGLRWFRLVRWFWSQLLRWFWLLQASGGCSNMLAFSINSSCGPEG